MRAARYCYCKPLHYFIEKSNRVNHFRGECEAFSDSPPPGGELLYNTIQHGRRV